MFSNCATEKVNLHTHTHTHTHRERERDLCSSGTRIVPTQIQSYTIRIQDPLR